MFKKIKNAQMATSGSSSTTPTAPPVTTNTTASSMPPPTNPSYNPTSYNPSSYPPSYNPPSYQSLQQPPPGYPQQPTATFGYPSQQGNGEYRPPAGNATAKYGIPPNALSVLSGYDIVMIIDDSGSMRFSEGGARISEVRECLKSFVEIACEVDSDGIDICFLNQTDLEENITDPNMIDTVMDKVKWDGPTPIGNRLKTFLNQYYGLLEQNPQTKPVSIVIITDGCPTDKQLLEQTIIDCSRRMQNRGTPQHIGIQFFQVGNDESAKRFLTKLDDDLEHKYHINDIVDCVHSGSSHLSLKDRFIKALSGGVNAEVDAVHSYH